MPLMSNLVFSRSSFCYSCRGLLVKHVRRGKEYWGCHLILQAAIAVPQILDWGFIWQVNVTAEYGQDLHGARVYEEEAESGRH